MEKVNRVGKDPEAPGGCRALWDWMVGVGLWSSLLLLCPLSHPQEPFVTRPPSVLGPYCAVPKQTPRGQLPEGSSAIQTMENPLLSLKSVLATWLSPSSTSWVTDTIIILCGLGPLLLSLPFPSDPSSPPPRNIRKHHPEPREKNRRRKKRGAALRRYRCCLRQLEVASSLMSHLKIHLSRIPNKGGSHPL